MKILRSPLRRPSPRTAPGPGGHPPARPRSACTGRTFDRGPCRAPDPHPHPLHARSPRPRIPAGGTPRHTAVRTPATTVSGASRDSAWARRRCRRPFSTWPVIPVRKKASATTPPMIGHRWSHAFSWIAARPIGGTATHARTARQKGTHQGRRAKIAESESNPSCFRRLGMSRSLLAGLSAPDRRGLTG